MVNFGITSLLIAVLAACGLYALKHRVQRLEHQLQIVEDAIIEEQMELTRLRAEWATLAEPARLARLASEHLELEPVAPRQIMSVNDIPLRRDLDLNRKSWPALVSSGVEVPLRFKPPATLAQRIR